jgi:hypothetical protein
VIYAQKSQSEKEKAVMLQEMEFLKLRLEESRKQLEENKRAHEAILKAFEGSSSEN